jgi:hypothetical protein
MLLPDVLGRPAGRDEETALGSNKETDKKRTGAHQVSPKPGRIDLTAKRTIAADFLALMFSPSKRTVRHRKEGESSVAKAGSECRLA